MAEEEGFEPSIRFWRIHTFQACAFNHSATPPFGAYVAMPVNLEGGNLTAPPPCGNARPADFAQITTREPPSLSESLWLQPREPKEGAAGRQPVQLKRAIAER